MDRFQPTACVRPQGRDRLPRDAHIGRTHIDHLLLLRIADPEDLRDIVRELMELLLAFPQRLLGAPAIRGVLDDRYDVGRPAVRAPHCRERNVGPDDLPILAPVALFP